MTTKFYNRPDLKQYRQKLRREMPQPELVLWQCLRAQRFLGLKFRRQYGIGGYIVDFYCRTIRLAVELDGDSHYEAGEQERDEARDLSLENAGVKVMRFLNTDVMSNIEGVLQKLEEVATERRRLFTLS